MVDKIAGWKLQFLVAELCREDKKIATMELLMQVCVEPELTWMNGGPAILRMFGAHIFEDDKFTEDDDYYFLP